jgi:small-conductance mechanosensitive channel
MRLGGPLYAAAAWVIPEALQRPVGSLALWQWAGIPLVLCASGIVAWILQWVLVRVSVRLTRLTAFKWDDQLPAVANGPLMLLLFSAVMASGLKLLKLPADAQLGFEHLGRSLSIIAVAWTILRILAVGARLVQQGIEVGTRDIARRRGIRTQVEVLRRVAEVAVWLVAAALLLTQFAVVRTVGVSLLASAGIAGLVIGLAAQKSIATLLAGIQLSLTQPIAIGDQVVIEGETGEVEEIGLTYVVVKIWDLRRLVVPITYFLDRSFQNWSKGADQILGTFTFQVDYTADVDAFRAEVKRLLDSEGKPLWDGEVWNVQVTETTDRNQTLRVLVSAPSPGSSWDLRCLLRERLISFLQRQPKWMPRVRSETRAIASEETAPKPAA